MLGGGGGHFLLSLPSTPFLHLLSLPMSERLAGEPGARAGADAGQGARGVATEAEPEGAGDAEHAHQDAQPAGGLREPAGRQAGAGHGDQRLQEDAGGRGAEV